MSDNFDSTGSDGTNSQEDRIEIEKSLEEHGIKPSELSAEETEDLSDDLLSDRSTNNGQDDDDGLSDVVPPEENDGND